MKFFGNVTCLTYSVSEEDARGLTAVFRLQPDNSIIMPSMISTHLRIS